jgi:phage shock protein E
MLHKAPSVVAILASAALIASCTGAGASGAEPAATGAAVTAPAVGADAGFDTISATDAAAVLADPPAGLVILDVRTAEEFAEGYIDGAVLLDFYRADFAAQLAEFDTDVPYLVYCRSGNRSGQTLSIMEDLGFSSVDDVDGGVIAWTAAGLPLVPG